MSLESFTRAYVECALWSSIDDDGEPLDSVYSADDLADETREKMAADCASFYNDPSNADDLAIWRNVYQGDDEAGHDFWLTRNRHGAGFWDRFYGETRESRAGESLSKAAEAFGSADLYIGDDGLIYQM